MTLSTGSCAALCNSGSGRCSAIWSSLREVTQAVMLEIWATAGRHDPARGGVAAWVATIAHRALPTGSVMRGGRPRCAGLRPDALVYGVSGARDERPDRGQLLHCLDQLTSPQRDAILLALYGGNTYFPGR